MLATTRFLLEGCMALPSYTAHRSAKEMYSSHRRNGYSGLRDRLSKISRIKPESIEIAHCPLMQGENRIDSLPTIFRCNSKLLDGDVMPILVHNHNLLSIALLIISLQDLVDR